MMVPNAAVDTVIAEILPKLSPGDIVIDGGNSFYKDTLSRQEAFEQKQIHFMDVGVSGGPDGALVGACLMIGGAQEDYKKLEGLFKTIAAPKAYAYLGPLGAGHFAKMVHNGIEYGMMEAIAEGAMVLRYSNFPFNLAEVFRIYSNRSVIESRLVSWTQEVFSEDLSNVSSVIASTGEGEWTVAAAKEKLLKVPVLEESFLIRQNSKGDAEDSPQGFRNKIVMALRGKFGHHKTEKESS
jgi:6-phosphogluconate dehydrogenase